MTERCVSSLREVPAERTLETARRLAPTLGITRVTDVTQLDRIGLPVFMSIRPDAQRGSVCVNAGKGWRHIDAEVGATMEAIELAWSEHRRCKDTVELRLTRVRDLGTGDAPFGVLDYCPVWGVPIDLDAEIMCAVATDVLTGDEHMVPVETVIHPLPDDLPGARYFGTSSNGLASGNTIEEATVHALAEVLERDVLSFHELNDRGRVVRNDTLPDAIRDLTARLDRDRFALVVRYLPNPFSVPAFSSVIYDRDQPELTSPGDGCHPIRDVAMIRSVVETAQARLSCIHGGRDDLADIYVRYAHLTAEQKSELFALRLANLSACDDPIDYRDIPDHSARCHDVASAFRVLAEAVYRQGFSRILRVVYTPVDYPVQVVRVIIPSMELHSKDSLRVGPRLLRSIRGD